jgi:predicted NUDIX family phosphoesterase/dephospho-CoA kinase
MSETNHRLKSEFLIVAHKLLEKERRPMSARELVNMGLDQKLFSDNSAGKTPHQTMKSKLSTHIRRYPEISPFVRTEPGRFYLRKHLNGNDSPFQAKAIRPPQSKERVLVYKASDLNAITNWQGLLTKWGKTAKDIFTQLKPIYLSRLEVEQNNDFTQILTYVLVDYKRALLAYRRGTYNRVEQYLRGASCIGFGGHLTEADLDLFNQDTMGVYECASRELMEELNLPDVDVQRLREREGLEIVGIINDDSSDVGRRHLAFVMRYEVSSSSYWNQPIRGEKAITQLRWISAQNPNRVWLWNFEYWSQLCLRQFAPELINARPAYRLIRRSSLKPPHIICVIGPVGSGKTEATDVLKSDFGYEEINSGQVVAQLIGIPAIPKTARLDFQERAWRFISEKQGPKKLANELYKIAQNMNTDRILIDGLRQKATLNELKKLAGKTKIGTIFVSTPADLAYNFYSERIAQGASIDKFLAARGSPVEMEVENLISIADVVLYNFSGRFQYRETIQALMQDLAIPKVKKL